MATPTPAAQIAENASRSVARDSATSEAAAIAEPAIITPRAPCRSTTRPTGTPSAAAITSPAEYAIESCAREPPSVPPTGTTSTPNRYWLAPYATIVTAPSTTTSVQP
jgi:hypothetical protein